MDPSQLKYTATHEWVAVDGNVATIGITDFAVKLLTDLVYVELPVIGKTFEQGKPFGVVESVKAASDLYAPVSGMVVAVNEVLPDDLARLSEDPFGDGWMIRLEMSNSAQLDALMNRPAYEKYCEAEAH